MRLKDRIEVLRKEKYQIETKVQDTVKACGRNLESLQEYNANKPLLVQIQKLNNRYQIQKEKLLDLNATKTWKRKGVGTQEEQYKGGPLLIMLSVTSPLRKNFIQLFSNSHRICLRSTL
jgi:hypothetical protein